MRLQNEPCGKTWESPKPAWHQVIEESIRRDTAAKQQRQVDEAARERRVAEQVAQIGDASLPQDYRARIDAAFMDRLKDPDSRRIVYLSTPLGSLVCGTINARNGFGGYTGQQPFLAYFEANGNLATLKVYPGNERLLYPAGSDLEGELLRHCGFNH
jgi:hypothetical protein